MRQKAVLPLLLATFILAACSGEAGGDTILVAPLDNIRLGMEKTAVTRHLPTTLGTFQETPLFVSLVDIREATFRAAGLSGVYLFFRKDGTRAVLNAAMLEFDKGEAGRIGSEADKRYGPGTNKRWKPAPDVRIELDDKTPGQIKLIYDTKGKKN